MKLTVNWQSQALAIGILFFCVSVDVSAAVTEAGTYADGRFSLPELTTAGEYYEVTVEEKGKALRAMRLPPGVSDFTLSTAGRPAEKFQWKFTRFASGGDRLEEYSPPQVKVVTLLQPQSGSTVRLMDRLRFQWEPVPAATSYLMTLKDVNGTAGAKPKEQVIQGTPTGGPPFHYFPRSDLSPATEYNWQVSALKNSDVIAKSIESPFQTQSTWFTAANRAGWKLQRAFSLQESDQKKGEAATIGFLRQAKGDKSYNTEFALLWQRPSNLGQESEVWASSIGASLEARLHSSGDAKKSDAVRLRATFDIDRRLGANAVYTAISAKYETDRSKSTEKILLEVLAAPSLPPFGTYWPSFDRDYTGVDYESESAPIRFRLQPTFGFDIGDNRKVGTSQETSGKLLRWVGKVKLELLTPVLARALGVDSALIFADGTARKLSREVGSPTYRVLASGMDIGLTDNIAISFRYVVGRDAPKFIWDRTSTLSIGAKF